jgi:phasin family protein
MSEAKPKRAPRNLARRNDAHTKTPSIEPPDAAPKTATAAVALETAAMAGATEAPAAAVKSTQHATPTFDDFWTDPWSALAESQSAMARGLEAVANEVTGLTRSGIAAATEAAKAMLGAKTFAEATEINTGFARRSFDAMIGGTAKLSEIGVKAATEAARPVLNRLGETWSSLHAP